MMPKIDLAEKKWATKMTTVAPKHWKKGVTGKESAYCRGVAEFIGVSSCNPDRAEAYKTGVGLVSEADFASAVRGKEKKWRERYIEAMAG
jgi:hypothetical protein